MKQPSSSVAESLGIHPASLMFRLAKLGASFDDAWPEISSDWVGALRAKDWDGSGSLDGLADGHTAPKAAASFSDDAARIVEKLWRTDRWGKMSATRDSIARHAHLEPARVEAAVRELLAAGLLVEHGAHGPYSLNQGRKRQIEEIAAARVDGAR